MSRINMIGMTTKDIDSPPAHNTIDITTTNQSDYENDKIAEVSPTPITRT